MLSFKRGKKTDERDEKKKSILDEVYIAVKNRRGKGAKAEKKSEKKYWNVREY